MKKYFALRLLPPRPGFAHDMTTEERSIMQQHVAYWRTLMDKDMVVVFGPVMDPAGVYGLGVVSAEGTEQIEELIRNDPANGLNRYEYHQMMAVVAEK